MLLCGNTLACSNRQARGWGAQSGRWDLPGMPLHSSFRAKAHKGWASQLPRGRAALFPSQQG